ncbi:DUF4184 family protein [Streptomyces celluloflavus]|uniref:DUF4184 family protein n=1 Tax=Streptomyces celluloflavus TaxID=58344 RepID=UPI003696B76A
MPFTLSHAAAVLPAVRRTGAARGPLIASALVAGSFAPDMTYFADSLIPGAMLFGAFTHSLRGVLTVDVLITAALVGGWLLLREPLVALLPRARQGRVHTLVRGRPWRPHRPGQLAASAGWFCLSAVLGATTHVVWDAFTHPGLWGTRLLPALDRTVGGRPLTMYLQYGTSALALCAIGWFLWSALKGGGGGGGAGPGVTAGGASGPAAGAVPGTSTDGASGPAAGAGGADVTAGGAGAVAGGVALAAVPALTVRWRLLSAVPAVLCVLVGAVHRTVRAHAVYGDAATWFDYVPSVLFGAGAGLALGLPLYAVAVRLRHRRTRRARPADDGGGTWQPGGAAEEADADAEGPDRHRRVRASGL